MIGVSPLASSSRGNAYLITASGAPPLLLEAGLPFAETQRRIWAQGYSVSDLGGCLITHEHGDHSKGAMSLASKGVDIYTSQGTAEAINKQGWLLHRIHPVKARAQFSIKGWEVLPFETHHDAAEPLGFLIQADGEKLVYITDTAYVPVKFQGLTIIMIECNYEAELLRGARATHPEIKTRVIKNHFGIDQVIKFFQANDTRGCREVWLLHLSNGHSDAENFKSRIQEVTGCPVYVAEE